MVYAHLKPFLVPIRPINEATGMYTKKLRKIGIISVCVGSILFLLPMSMSEVAASHSSTIPIVTAASES